MGLFVLRRLLHTLPVLVLASLVVFSMLHLVPGDPVEIMVGAAFQGRVPEDAIQRIRVDLGLDQPLPIQYLRWAGNAVRGDFGTSYTRNRPVIDVIGERLPSTLELAAAAGLISAVLGLGLGLAAALKRGTWIDGAVMLISLGGVSMPGFWLSMLLILLFSVFLAWLPATGSGGIDRLILPAFALGYEGVALVARLTRSNMLEVLGRQYITTAHAKGLPDRVVIVRHALRNALVPVVTVLGLQVGRLLAGSVIVETVFARQGVGQLAIEAIQGKDYPLVQAVILLTASSYVLANLLVDLSYGFMDPQIRTA